MRCITAIKIAMEIILSFFCVILILITMQINVETRTMTSQFQYSKVEAKSFENNQKDRVVKCSELPAPVLNDILGAAFNSRYKWHLKSMTSSKL